MVSNDSKRSPFAYQPQRHPVDHTIADAERSNYTPAQLAAIEAEAQAFGVSQDERLEAIGLQRWFSGRGRFS